MSKMIQGIKTLLGMKSNASCFDRFHETADRVSQKTEMLLAERNGFAHSVSRMKSRRRKATVKR